MRLLFNELTDITSLLHEQNRSFIFVEDAETDALRKKLSQRKDKEACHEKTVQKKPGTIPYPHGWHERQGCQELPVGVAADSMSAKQRSEKAERAGISPEHAKAAREHADAYHSAKKSGFHHLAGKHKAAFEAHRTKAVELAHPRAKEDTHAYVTRAMEGNKEEVPKRLPPVVTGTSKSTTKTGAGRVGGW